MLCGVVNTMTEQYYQIKEAMNKIEPQQPVEKRNWRIPEDKAEILAEQINELDPNLEDAFTPEVARQACKKPEPQQPEGKSSRRKKKPGDALWG
jgi:hypothetical protein